MALVVSRKRARYSDGYSPMQIVPTNSSNYVSRNPSSGGWTQRMSTYRSNSRRRRGYRSYRSAFNVYNTNTNPVYPRPEVKYTDTNMGAIGAGMPISSTGITPLSLNNVGTGSLVGNRVGTQISTKSIYYSLVFNFGTATQPIAIRHVLLWDRQSNGALPAYTDVFATTPIITSPLNLTNRNRFVILADERITMSPQGDNIRYVTGFRKINQLSTFEPTGTNNMPFTGNLVVMLASDEPSAVPANVPSYYGTWRCRYQDC